MKKMVMVAILLVFATFTTEARQKPAERSRVLISTDIGGTDPDGNQSVAHLPITGMTVQEPTHSAWCARKSWKTGPAAGRG